jgi:hypothetical protein
MVGSWLCLPSFAHAESVTIAWTYDLSLSPRRHSGFQVGRCVVTPPATTCSTFTDLPAGTIGPLLLTWTDTTAVAGNQVCYAVQAIPVTGTTRSLIGIGAWTCGVVPSATLAAPTALRIVPQGASTVKSSAKGKASPQ